MKSSPGEIQARNVVSLANRDLDLNNLLKFARALDDIHTRIAGSEFTRLKLALLVQGTTDYIAPAIRASAVRHGLLADIYVPPYGQGMAELLMPDSDLHRFAADVALIAESAESLGLDKATMDINAATDRVGNALANIGKMVDELQGAGTRTVILQSLPVPAQAWCGSLDRRTPGSVASQIEVFNRGLADLCEEKAAVYFDADALAGLVGRANWFDSALWFRAKVPFSLAYVPLYAEKLSHLLRALKGKSAKCLVLDLDNTCWGGIIGDDGLDGIKIGQGSAEGEAFLALQHYALSLKERGVVLAVCSKNEEANARLPFEKHPDMALRLDDIAVFVANWTDKASNLAHIAKTLNIGVDALVFLDDNPAERARVRQELPQVSVPEVDDEVSHYPAALAHAGYFETLGLSADDAKRAEQYRVNAQRSVAMETIGNYDDYLASLDMDCTIRQFDEVGRTRIAQLINKSNQFNLTTRRYSEAEVAEMQGDPGCFAMQVRLKDRFGDNGMISVVIFKSAGDDWICDTWLMSCRVLKRRVEEAVLATAVRNARSAGVSRLIGDYLPTAKNGMVENHFKELGFNFERELEGGGTRWSLDVAGYCEPDLPMQIDAEVNAMEMAQ
ncbi:HAD-IIIC family phosphatase [Roseibium album]|uniref:HAD-IIIC family phosphatase n=1 Tax=Roseibium album TaxID=311410 RepID=UPI00249286BC|nr:HAD-IIIC family phosphatase [Roseibium album]